MRSGYYPKPGIELVCDTLARTLQRARNDPIENKIAIRLSKSQIAIIQLLAWGLDAKAVTRVLGITHAQFRSRIKYACKKIDVSGRLQMVVTAMQRGLVE